VSAVNAAIRAANTIRKASPTTVVAAGGAVAAAADAADGGRAILALKSTLVDVVTETDKEAQRVIEAALKGVKMAGGEEIGWIGEEDEGGGTDQDRWDALVASGVGYAWCVDPLDGTSNFVSGIPHVAVSIALVRVQAEADATTPTVGVILDVYHSRLYLGIRGRGAFAATLPLADDSLTLDGSATLRWNKLAVAPTPDLAHAIISLGFPYDRRPEVLAWHTGNACKVVSATRGIRRFGAAALDLAAVASGQVGGYFELGIHVWDYAAGAVLVQEAGGLMCDPFANDVAVFSLATRRALAILPTLAEPLLAILADSAPPEPV
jgi:myo-inositol-1(or 4)-monophosphatase